MAACGNKKKGLVLPVILLVLGMGILFYPMVSNYINLIRQREAIAGYKESVENRDEGENERLMEGARAYNEHLRSLGAPLVEYEQLNGEYYGTLDVTGTGIMGYITIPKISVELPVYHGMDDRVLNRAAGHMEGTSLPVGGESTHAVISAHRGLPGAKLFTELDRIGEGDIFMVTTPGGELTYQVDQIQVVLPTELELLNVTEGKEYVTLMTCTPYGINSHRLLVRGVRIPGEAAEGEALAHSGISIGALIPAIGIPVLFTVLVVLLFLNRKKR